MRNEEGIKERSTRLALYAYGEIIEVQQHCFAADGKGHHMVSVEPE